MKFFLNLFCGVFFVLACFVGCQNKTEQLISNTFVDDELFKVALEDRAFQDVSNTKKIYQVAREKAEQDISSENMEERLKQIEQQVEHEIEVIQ